MHDRLERYVAEDLLAPAGRISVTRQQVRRVDVHWHDFYELVYVSEGTATHTVNGVDQDLRPGTVFLLTPADFHQIRVDGERALTYYNVVVDASQWESRVDELLTGPSGRAAWTLADLSGLEGDFRRLWTEFRDDRRGATAMMNAVLDCILVELDRHQPAAAPRGIPGGHGSDLRGVRRAVRYVDSHFREPLTLADVATQAHLSPNYFSERFREVTGSSFQTYLQHRRLRFARSLLASTDLGVTEVCHAAGFGSLSHFGRAYRARYGESPTASRTGVPASDPLVAR